MVDLAVLSETQRQAVCAPDTCPLLIRAGPGSGKTLVLTHRIAWLVAQRGLPPWQLLPIAFTNQAVEEMRARLGHLLGQQAQQIPVTTFHAYGQHLVRRFELASGGLAFDQMLTIPVWALRRTRALRDFLHQQIAHVLVDEGQDVTAVQAELVQHLVAGHGRLTVVGDGDQCIFQSTAGALGLDWFPAHAPGATTCWLHDNYRSASGIVALCNSLMGRTA